MGKPDDWRGDTSSGLRSRRSGARCGSSGSGAGAGHNVQRCKRGVAACKSAKVRDIQTGPDLYLMLNTRTRGLMAETRDLRMNHVRR